jgi:hypothetical protein
VDPSDALLTICELAIAILGFAGVVTLLQSPEMRQRTQNRFRLRIMVEHAIGSLVFSLLGIALIASHGSGPLTWSVASGTLAVFLPAHAVSGQIRLHRIFDSSAYPAFNTFILSAQAVATLIQILNALGVLFERSFTGYFIGLAWLLLFAAILFVRVFVYSGALNFHRDG